MEQKRYWVTRTHTEVYTLEVPADSVEEAIEIAKQCSDDFDHDYATPYEYDAEEIWIDGERR